MHGDGGITATMFLITGMKIGYARVSTNDPLAGGRLLLLIRHGDLKPLCLETHAMQHGTCRRQLRHRAITERRHQAPELHTRGRSQLLGAGVLKGLDGFGRNLVAGLGDLAQRRGDFRGCTCGFRAGDKAA